MAFACAAGAVLTARWMDAKDIVIFGGLAMIGLGGGLARSRAKSPWSFDYPPPTRFEGTVAAIGVAFAAGGGLGLGIRWLAG